MTDVTFAESILNGQGGDSNYATGVSQDRLIRKETALGQMREIQPPQGHIGLNEFAPFMEVDSDDVIFDFIKGGLQEGMAPARAEDAESELAQKDDLFYGQGRASLIDWALKDKYTASDVTRYRDNLIIQAALRGQSVTTQLNSAERITADFDARVARDDAKRVKKLYNRLEWLIMEALFKGKITYVADRMQFDVNYYRPADQQSIAPKYGYWNEGTTFDPISEILELKDKFYDKYGVELTKAKTSRKMLRNLWKADKFTALTGLVTDGGETATKIDPNYLMDWSPQKAISIIENATNVKFETYDSVYQIRPIGSNVGTNVRFSPEDEILFYPEFSALGEIDDTDIGFGKTLTAPHAEGNWSPGFYEWEQSKRDPWLTERGSGIKAWPVLPYLAYTVTMKAIKL